MRIEAFESEHLPSLLALVNLHLGAVVPGWALSEAFLARHLERDETEVVTEPWVAERASLYAVEHERVIAAAHLLRYRDDDGVGESFRGLGEIGWALGYPDRPEALAAVITAGRDRFAGWGVRQESGWGAGLPAGPMPGVPDVWPHVAAALEAAGYRADLEHVEALYGGPLPGTPTPEPAAIAGLALRRTVGRWGVRFAAMVEGDEVGHAECVPDMTLGGAMPAPAGWAELQELVVAEAWRNRGVGGWLVGQVVAWLRLGGIERIVLSVAAGDEARGAGRFYERFGWRPLVRTHRAWPRADRGANSAT